MSKGMEVGISKGGLNNRKKTQKKFIHARSCGVGSGFDRKILKTSGFK